MKSPTLIVSQEQLLKDRYSLENLTFAMPDTPRELRKLRQVIAMAAAVRTACKRFSRDP